MKEAQFEPLIIVRVDDEVRATMRPFRANAGEGHKGHQHKIDHATVVIAGKLQLKVNGEFSRVVMAGESFEVPANKEHELIALVDGTQWLCSFFPRSESDKNHMQTLSMEA